MVEYNKVNVKLTDTQLKKLNKTGTTLRMSLKMLDKMICFMNYYWQQDKKQS